MAAEGDAPVPHEIVIVRRRGGDGEDGHHGGAWKIAFADLMTAMMAFFLVMWLLNASDKEKIQQIATYFNPMKLNSKRPTAKGLDEQTDVPKAEKTEDRGKSEKQNPKGAEKDKKGKMGGVQSGGDGDKKEGSEQQAEEQLFNDPYGMLAKLAAKAEAEQTLNANKGGTGRHEGDLPGGDVYNNPFQPFNERSDMTLRETPTDPPPLSLEEPAPPPLEVAPAPPSVIPNPEGPPVAAQAPAEPAVPATSVADSADPAASSADAGKAEARKLEGDILTALANLKPEDKPSIEVTKTADGLLVSLTDDFRFGMFSSASAQPNPDLVLVMEKVGKILAGRDGKIVVRGHTDGRAFRSQKNNNWRLSADRAQIAYHMLVRGGVDPNRIDHIEGHADKNLKIPSDPGAAQNRRIEILLKVPNA